MLVDDAISNQWRGHVFGCEIGSKGYVAKSPGFALGKLGLCRTSIEKIKQIVPLTLLRSSNPIYLSRKVIHGDHARQSFTHPYIKMWLLQILPTMKIFITRLRTGGFTHREIREAVKLRRK